MRRLRRGRKGGWRKKGANRALVRNSMPRNLPFGDKFRARFKIVQNVVINGGATPTDVIEIQQFNPENLDNVTSLFGEAAGMAQCAANFNRYRVRSCTVKTTFFPDAAGLIQAAWNTNLVLFGSSNQGLVQIPTTVTTDELIQNRNVILKPIGSGGLYAKPVSVLHKMVPKRIVPDSEVNDIDWSGATTANTIPPFFSAPTAQTVAQLWIASMDPGGLPGALTRLGVLRTELFYSVDFYSRKNVNM